MGRSQESFSKKEREKKRQKKREEKARKKEERKANSGDGGFDDMIAYVDANGNIVDTPPDPSEREEIDPETIELGIPPKEEVEEADLQGKVDYFDDSKGFGFIKVSTGDKYFFHISAVDPDFDVREGEKVSFKLEQGPKGLNAVEVKSV